MPIGPTRPMKITFEVNQIGFDSIDNYKDFDIDLNQGRAKKEIQTLLRSYKLIIAFSKTYIENDKKLEKL